MPRITQVAASFVISLLSFHATAQPIIPDSSFSGDGLHSFTFYNNIDRGYGCAIQPDQKVVIAGLSRNPATSYFELCVARFLLTGDPDTAFSGDGFAYISMGIVQTIGGLTPFVNIAPDGKIVIVNAGRPPSGMSQDMMICRLDTAGAPDSAFNGGASLFVDMTGTHAWPDIATAFDFDSSGNLYAVGVSRTGGTPFDNDFAVIKVKPNGQLDSTFDADGKRLYNPSGAAEFGAGIKVISDGKIVFGGSAGSNMMLMKIDSTGMVDPTFNGTGFVTVNFGSATAMTSLMTDNLNRIVFAGFRTNGNDVAVGRYLQSGLPDPGFNGSGLLTFNTGPANIVNAMAIQTDGKILVAGSADVTATGRDFMVARIDTSGAVDVSFNNSGFKTQPIVVSNTDEDAFGIALTSNGSIFLSGSITYSFVVDEDIGLMLLHEDFTSGSNDHPHFQPIKAYPNPVRESFQVHCTVSGTGYLSDKLGRVVDASELYPGENTIVFTGVDPGVYLFSQPASGTSIRIIVIR